MKKTFVKEGTQYWVRFFESESLGDLKGLKEVTTSKSVRKWMTDIYGVKHNHYKMWMREQGKGNVFLFAISGVRKVHGFVYVYPSELIRNKLEVSYAKREKAPSGLMARGIRLACGLVSEYLLEKNPRKNRQPVIIAEIEEQNIPSIKVIEKAGFEQMRKFDEDGNGVWEMKWGQ